MRKTFFLLVFAASFACSEPKDSPMSMSTEPVSVRGWIDDVAGAKRAENMDMEVARRTEMFQQTSVWVEKTQFASGGVASNGSFLVLDVPPGTSTIGFSAPGAENAKVILENIPGNADVLIPEIILKNGIATVRDPKAIRVRVPGDVDKPRATGKNAMVCGNPVPIVETSLSALMDRRDYPNPPGFRPVATVK